MADSPPAYFLADDLSGALDAAAAFHRAGRQVRVLLSAEAWTEAGPGELIGLTTESRNSPPMDARNRVRAACQAARERGAVLVYKKIDSTLRGPVGPELAELLAQFPNHRVLLAPANPGVGRTVYQGQLLVNGVPVDRTEFGRDPGSPSRTSRIAQILGEEFGARVEIPDTHVESDLVAAVRRFEAAGKPWIGVGSGALARPIAERLPRTSESAGAWPDIANSGVLMIGGSTHMVNRSQSAHLVTETGCASIELNLDRPAEAGRAVAVALGAAGAAVLLAPRERTDPAAALRATVDAAVAAMDATGVRRVFATGGETAFALCERLGVNALTFLDEIEPGVSLSTGRTRSDKLLLAVKPGGFGDLRTWLRVWQRLRAAG